MNYLKALYGAAVAFLGSLSAVLVGNESFTQVTDAQWVTIAIATLSALGIIWAVPGKQSSGSTVAPAPVAAPVVPPLPAEPQA